MQISPSGKAEASPTAFSKAIPVTVMFLLFAMISFVTGLQNPFGVIARHQFEVSNFASQLGNFANFIAYLCMGVPAGLLLSRVGYKRTALAAVAVGFLGVLIMWLSGRLESFPVYLAGAFVAGFSMCMLNTVVNPMLNTIAGGGKRGNQLIQFGGACNSVAATIVPVLVGYLIGDLANARISNANPALYTALAVFLIAFVVLLVVKIPEPHTQPRTQAAPAASPSGASPWSYRHFLLGVVAIFIYVGLEVAIPSVANLYMTADAASGGLGMAAAVAGTLCGTYWFLMFIGRLLGGLLGAKLTARAQLAAVASLIALFILLAILLPSDIMVRMPVFRSNLSFAMQQVPLSVMFLILCGLCTSVMWGNIFNLSVEGLGQHTALASGIFMTMVCGGGIIPPLQGLLADAVGYSASYWLLFACALYLLFYALAGSRPAK
ncbi:MAG: MFS transporter [Bacteroidales bacterium]|nr:MFS transporter [Bacteroidales bacterium]